MTDFQLFDCRLPGEVLETLETAFRLGQLAAGPAVAQLERQMEDRFPGRHAVAVGDMTHALALVLRLAGVRDGDEVLSLAFNCMSSNTAIAMAGAHVAWVDVDPATATFDLEQARSRLTQRTRAAIAYHVSGYPADLVRLRRLCDEQGLPLIEDANNAFGARVDGAQVGMIGDYAVFSFYANRQINAIDGGIIICKRPEDADRARRLRRFGIDTARFRDRDGEIDPALDVAEIGTCSPLSNVNATLALASIADVDARIARSRRNAVLLAEATRDIGITPIAPIANAEPVYWTWLIRVSNRDRILRELKLRGIMCSKLHHPNHHYSGFGVCAPDLPGTTVLEKELLAIPCGWWLDETQIAALASTLRSVVQACP